MDPPFSGYVLDPSKCQKLSINEKREIVWQLAKWPESAPEKLQTWSRRDLLEILCVEMGKERKYTGLTKQKLIESIFKIVAMKKSGSHHLEDIDSISHLSPSEPQNRAKRHRKNENPSRLPIEPNNISCSDESIAPNSARICLNAACRASFSQDDLFCKRCSCCICFKYDDNKDPSLWLFCSSEDSSHGDVCGLSCHIDCALKDERTGIAKNNGHCSKLDGSYYCVHCGKVNSLLGCWRKQLAVAKDARRVDVLCFRVSLSHKLLSSTQKYKRLHEIVDEAIKKLEVELDPLFASQNRGRGIVNRLSVGAEVQKLCVRAIDALDLLIPSNSYANEKLKTCTLLAESKLVPSEFIRIKERSSSSLIIYLDCEIDQTVYTEEILGYTIWHRRVEDSLGYPTKPTGVLYRPNQSLLIAGLAPATRYFFKVVAFSEIMELQKWEIVGVTTDDLANKKEAIIINPVTEETSTKTNSSNLSNPSFEADESHNTGMYADLNKSPGSYFGYREKPELLAPERPGLSGSALDEEPNSTELNQPLIPLNSDNASKTPIGAEMVIASSAKSCINLLLEKDNLEPDKEPGSSSKKRNGSCDEFCKKEGPMEGDYEFCVKMIRWLECEGYIESNFRVKFLTWFSLRASIQERRVVSVYVDTLIDDPGSLAGQLVDTFSDTICSKRPPPVPNGFCMRLWH